MLLAISKNCQRMTDLDILVELLERTIILRSPEDLERVDFLTTAQRLLDHGVLVPNQTMRMSGRFACKALKAILCHWDEFGPEHGFSELLHHIRNEKL